MLVDAEYVFFAEAAIEQHLRFAQIYWQEYLGVSLVDYPDPDDFSAGSGLLFSALSCQLHGLAGMACRLRLSRARHLSTGGCRCSVFASHWPGSSQDGGSRSGW